VLTVPNLRVSGGNDQSFSGIGLTDHCLPAGTVNSIASHVAKRECGRSIKSRGVEPSAGSLSIRGRKWVRRYSSYECDSHPQIKVAKPGTAGERLLISRCRPFTGSGLTVVI
jgi:hypothetical protein